jgi:hypothetical protein
MNNEQVSYTFCTQQNLCDTIQFSIYHSKEISP